MSVIVHDTFIENVARGAHARANIRMFVQNVCVQTKSWIETNRTFSGTSTQLLFVCITTR